MAMHEVVADRNITHPNTLLPTVKIDDGHGGFVIINKSDFNAATHTLYVPKAKKPKAEVADEATDDETPAPKSAPEAAPVSTKKPKVDGEQKAKKAKREVL